MKIEAKEIQEKMSELEELLGTEMEIQADIRRYSQNLTEMLWTLTERGDMTWSKYQQNDIVDGGWTATYDGTEFVVSSNFSKYDDPMMNMLIKVTYFSDDERFDRVVIIDVLKCPPALNLLTYLCSKNKKGK